MHARMPTLTKMVETTCRTSVMGLIIRRSAPSCVVLVAAYMVFVSVCNWFPGWTDCLVFVNTSIVDLLC